MIIQVWELGTMITITKTQKKVPYKVFGILVTETITM